jgi:pSer/pThr/pTyr-binding forkhead associated (FHA) protein
MPRIPRGTPHEIAEGTNLTRSGSHQNAPTRLATVHLVRALAAPDTRTAFAAVYGQLVAARAQDRHGVLVAAVDSIGAVVGSAILAPGDAVTIGRHSQCPIHLADDWVSLRHVAFHVTTAPPSDTTIRVWDLHTGHRFVTEDGVGTYALIADGAVFARLSRYMLLAIPTSLPDGKPWPAASEDGYALLPPRHFIARLAEGSHGDQPLPEPPAPADPAHRITRVTRTPMAVTPTQHDPADATVATLVLLSPGRRRTFQLSATALERGVLVGRYARCAGGIDDDDQVSRVHVLLASVGPDIWAIDLASTNGLWRDADARVDAIRIENRVRLQIGDSSALELERKLVASA